MVAVSPEQISERIAELKVALEEANPGYSDQLKLIHKMLKDSESTVYLLTDEEIGVICAGLIKKTNTVILEEAKKVSKKKASKNLTAEDF